MNANELFQAGQLTDAVQSAINTVKSAPNDMGARFFLAALLCFQGEWERADRQLDVLIKQSSDVSQMAQLMRQLIRGEVNREQVFSQGRPPELAVGLPREIELQLELCTALRLKQFDDLPGLSATAAEAQASLKGTCNDIVFDGLQDMDDRLRGTLEAITATGKYYWIPWQSVAFIAFTPPRIAMDLLWRRARIDVNGGPQGDVYIPVRYPFPQSSNWSDAHRLSRATDWDDKGTSVVQGIGQRMFFVGEDDFPILELQSITVNQPVSSDNGEKNELLEETEQQDET